MSLKRVFLCAAFLLVPACFKRNSDTPTTEAEKTIYMMGQMQGDSLLNLNFDDHELDLFFAGVKKRIKAIKEKQDKNTSSSSDDENELRYQDYQMHIQNFISERIAESALLEKHKNQKFVESFMSSGATKLPSGLAYKIKSQGDQNRIKGDDAQVELHLHTTLRTGAVVQSTIDQGTKQTFHMYELLPGLVEGVNLIGQDGEIELMLPPELAYGQGGVAALVPGGAYILAYVKLFKISNTKE